MFGMSSEASRLPSTPPVLSPFIMPAAFCSLPLRYLVAGLVNYLPVTAPLVKVRATRLHRGHVQAGARMVRQPRSRGHRGGAAVM